MNFNGEGEYSDEASIYACLSPSGFSEPRYVSSTEESLTVEWDAPSQTNGCPITAYLLYPLNDAEADGLTPAELAVL